MLSSSVISDQELVRDYINGDNSSFEILLTRHKSRVFSFIMSKIKNRDITEDIFQDTFIKVINSLQRGRYNEEGKFLPWMMRIAHNLVIDHFRKEAKMKRVRPTDDFNIFDVINDGSRNQEEDMIRKRVHSDLNRLIKELPEDQMEVLRMRYFEDMSFKKISEITGVSINTALGRMRYALINLRKLSEQKNVDLAQK
ncbi:MAG: RNA polymerase subunit sigma-24 [Flavobacteriales bacterium]|nr:RNA polymerase subunit sigma-24 [Flavobacteriales bacterium]